MKIIAADDEPLALRSLENAIREAKPDAKLVTFAEPELVIEYAKDHKIDVAFLDVEMGTMTGIDVAKRLKALYPKINIVFVTGYDKYMGDAIALRMSGYVTKPVSRDKIVIELEDLKHPVEEKQRYEMYVRCFGNFDIFVNGVPLEFEKAKTKELFAYLIDRRGSSATTGELRSVLWSDVDTDVNTRSYLSKVKKDLVQVLASIGMSDVFIEKRGRYAIDPARIKCDYFDFLAERPEGIRAYNGEYMSQYSWGEEQHAALEHLLL